MRPTPTTSPGARVVAVLLMVSLAAAPACGSKDQGAKSTSSTVAQPATTTATSTTSLPPPETSPGAAVAVTPYFLRDGYVGAGQQRFVQGPAVAAGALDALLAGPNDVDEMAGLGTAIARGVRVNSIELVDGVATVDFNRAFETADTRPQVGQVVYTLTQFATVDKVRFLVDGEPNGATGVMPIGRADLEDVTSGVFVESPTPGQPLATSLRFAGTANTFEANVPWKLEDPSGNVLAQGATTASSGMGKRGSFDATLPVPGYSGPAFLVTWVENMETGAQEQVSRIPVTITG